MCTKIFAKPSNIYFVKCHYFRSYQMDMTNTDWWFFSTNCTDNNFVSNWREQNCSICIKFLKQDWIILQKCLWSNFGILVNLWNMYLRKCFFLDLLNEHFSYVIQINRYVGFLKTFEPILSEFINGICSKIIIVLKRVAIFKTRVLYLNFMMKIPTWLSLKNYLQLN